MNLLFYFGHPAHYHFFKNTIKSLSNKKHQIKIIIKTKDILEDLLKKNNLDYVNILPEGRKDSKIYIFLGMLKRDLRLGKIILKDKVDLMIGTDPTLAHIGKSFNIPSIICVEDDISVIPHFAKLTYPFTNNILAPVSCDLGKWSKKKITYNGYQKLAYLHPNHFKPDPNKLNPEFLKEPFFIIRTSKLAAHHDFGIKGLNKDIIAKIIEILKKSGKVFISAEGKFRNEFTKYKLDINLNDIHHYLFYSDLLISDSQSMTVEAAVLGTPSIRFSDFAGRIGVLEELEHKYGITFGIKTSESEKLYAQIKELLAIPNLKEEWQLRRRKMLQDKIDVTAFIVWLIENYPQSVNIIRENPDYQLRFE